MTHTYQIEGMHCGSCISKVKSELLKLGDITEANVKLDNPQATISMTHHISLNKLQQTLDKAGKFTIKEIAANDQMPQQAPTKSWIITYKPLLLIFAFITGIATLTSWKSGLNSMYWMNNFMGAFFIAFSFFKLLDLKGFTDSYTSYDLLAKRIYNYGFIYPFIELGLGLAYISNWQPVYTNLVTVVVMGFSSIGVIQAVADRRKIRCACLGAVFNLPMSTITIIENLLMVAMALFSLTML